MIGESSAASAAQGHCADDILGALPSLVAVWLSGNVVGHINEVTLPVRRAGLMLRWVTVCGYTVLVFNQATQANSAWSSLHG